MLGHYGASYGLCVQVLRNLAFLANLPRSFFDAIVSQGLLLRFGQGEVIWAPPEPAGDEDAVSGGAPCERSGIFIVIAGLISRTFRDADGNTEARRAAPRCLQRIIIVSLSLRSFFL